MAPAMELNEVVRAHDPHEMDARRAAPDPSEGLIGKARADAGLDVRNTDARTGDEAPRRLDPRLERRKFLLRFERIARRHQPPHAIKPKTLERQAELLAAQAAL